MLLPYRCAAEMDLHLGLAAALVHAPALQAQATDEDIEVAVKRDGPRVIVDVRLQVAATRAQV